MFMQTLDSSIFQRFRTICTSVYLGFHMMNCHRYNQLIFPLPTAQNINLGLFLLLSVFIVCNIQRNENVPLTVICLTTDMTAAYLMGCPIRGVILDPIIAMQMGIQGQAGAQFWDEKLQNELAEGQLSGTTFDRRVVLFAGIATEALIYGEAEGGENDEDLIRSISILLEPPFSMAQMSNQARWSVLQ